MKKKLREELRKTATSIITSNQLDTIDTLYEAAKGLYEKLAVLRFIERELNDLEVDVSKNAIAAKFEKMANSVLHENSSVPESNPHEEDIITPGIETIKDMVSEMPNETPVDEVLAAFMAKPEYMKNDQELFMPGELSLKTNNDATSANFGAAKSLNDSATNTALKIDLNNRLAFVKHLFKGSTEDYNRVLSQLNTIDSHERSVSFIENMVKPDYEHWAGKEEYVERFMAVIERRFS